MSQLKQLVSSTIICGLITQAALAGPAMPDRVPSTGQFPTVQGIATLTVTGGNYWHQQRYESGDRPSLAGYDESGTPLPDGFYRYELRMIKSLPVAAGDATDNRVPGPARGEGPLAEVITGQFEMDGGSMVFR